jgi:uncharacterized FlaG/YvyC family protein
MSEDFDYRELRGRGFSEARMRERRELEARDGEFARARQQRQREERREQRDALEELRAELQDEVAKLRGELHAQHEVVIQATGEALGETVNDMRGAIKQIERELFTLVDRRFGELMGRIDAVAPEARSRAPKGFKFASEHDDVVDLPNPLRKHIN